MSDIMNEFINKADENKTSTFDNTDVANKVFNDAVAQATESAPEFDKKPFLIAKKDNATQETEFSLYAKGDKKWEELAKQSTGTSACSILSTDVIYNGLVKPVSFKAKMFGSNKNSNTNKSWPTLEIRTLFHINPKSLAVVNSVNPDASPSVKEATMKDAQENLAKNLENSNFIFDAKTLSLNFEPKLYETSIRENASYEFKKEVVLKGYGFLPVAPSAQGTTYFLRYEKRKPLVESDFNESKLDEFYNNAFSIHYNPKASFLFSTVFKMSTIDLIANSIAKSNGSNPADVKENFTQRLIFAVNNVASKYLQLENKTDNKAIYKIASEIRADLKPFIKDTVETKAEIILDKYNLGNAKGLYFKTKSII